MECGYTIESFWDQTSRTLEIAFKAREAVLLQEYNDRVTQAYNIAALSRYPRNKRLPRLQSLLARPKRRQSWREQLEVCKMWTFALGGIVKNG